MTALAPGSASLSGEISPVWAPDALGGQPGPPITSPFEPANFAANAAISVAGGQTSKSAFAATLEAPASMASNSAIEDRRPFIFQLPAINGRMTGLISQKFLQKAQGPASLAEPGKLGQIGPNGMLRCR